jgi:hypothetical protein
VPSNVARDPGSQRETASVIAELLLSSGVLVTSSVGVVVGASV